MGNVGETYGALFPRIPSSHGFLITRKHKGRRDLRSNREMEHMRFFDEFRSEKELNHSSHRLLL